MENILDGRVNSAYVCGIQAVKHGTLAESGVLAASNILRFYTMKEPAFTDEQIQEIFKDLDRIRDLLSNYSREQLAELRSRAQKGRALLASSGC